MKTKNVYLVRHGESEGNARRLVKGSPADRLTSKGRKQVLGLKALLEGYSLRLLKVMSSTMLRTIETFELFDLLSELMKYPELKETDAGLVSEWSLEEFNRKYEDFWTNFDPNRKFPGEESHSEIYKRVISFVKADLENENEKEIMIMGYAGTISSIFQWAYGVPIRYFSKFVVSNASLSVLEIDSVNAPPCLTVFNIN